jgi:hypothetical protein
VETEGVVLMGTSVDSTVRPRERPATRRWLIPLLAVLAAFVVGIGFFLAAQRDSGEGAGAATLAMTTTGTFTGGDTLFSEQSGVFEVTEGANALGCARGTFTEEYSAETDTVEKTLTCVSGIRSGAFSIAFPHALRLEPDDPEYVPSATWTVTGAIGGFEGLTGQGTIDFSFEGWVGGRETLTGSIAYE